MADNTNASALPGSPPRGSSSFPAIRRSARRCSRAGARASTNDAATVAGWWAQWPGAVPALDLARCGLVVLDGDRHHPGVDGVAALRELLRQQPGLDVAALPMTKTPRDGVHVFFQQCRPALTNSRGSLPAGIDVRGAGGYVIAPGARLSNRRQLRADRRPARSGCRVRRQEHSRGAGRHRRPDPAGAAVAPKHSRAATVRSARASAPTRWRPCVAAPTSSPRWRPATATTR